VRRAALLAAALGTGLVGLAVALRFGPALAFSWALAMPPPAPGRPEALASPESEEITVPVVGGHLTADLYRPRRARGALLLVHGLSPAGGRQPDLVRLARLLARHDQVVLVPTFEGLAAFRLSGREVDDIGGALAHLAAYGQPVGVAGFSFGAGPALLAARTMPALRVVGSFGGYADLRSVVTYVTTGVHTFRGRRYVQRSEDYNRWKLLALLVGLLDQGRDRDLLEAIARRKLANPAESTISREVALGEEGRRVLALVLNREELAVAARLADLPPRVSRALATLSPLPVVSGLPGRLLLAHGVRDESIPFTESLRLAEAAGPRARVAVFRTFHHTGPPAASSSIWGSLGDRALDGWNLFRLADDLLAG
jgi:dienelactone hydrolase